MDLRCASLLLLGTLLAAADPPAPDVAFLDAEQARAAIVDESIEPYFSLLQTREMSAKTGSAIIGDTLPAQREACRECYRAAVREFTEREQRALKRIVGEVQPFLAAHYPVFAAQPWRFIKLAAPVEGGLAHTRGRCIVVPDLIAKDLATPGEPDERVDAEERMLLVHEQTHVVQRLHPQLFAPLYTEAWGFVRLPTAPALTAELAARQLVNPDGVACVWAYPVGESGHEELIQPLATLGGDAAIPRMPGDIRSVARFIEGHGDTVSYLLDEQRRLREVPLGQVTAYGDAFDPAQENFHPNEICAELFAAMVVADMLTVDPVGETPCQRALRAWAAAYLGSADPTVAHAPLARMAAPAKREAIAPTATEQWYTLQEGDSLSSVARRFQVDLGWIIRRNDLEDEAVVKPGLRLVVPKPAEPKAP
jgi:hypothetical protein